MPKIAPTNDRKNTDPLRTVLAMLRLRPSLVPFSAVSGRLARGSGRNAPQARWYAAETPKQPQVKPSTQPAKVSPPSNAQTELKSAQAAAAKAPQSSSGLLKGVVLTSGVLLAAVFGADYAGLPVRDVIRSNLGITLPDTRALLGGKPRESKVVEVPPASVVEKPTAVEAHVPAVVVEKVTEAPVVPEATVKPEPKTQPIPAESKAQSVQEKRIEAPPAITYTVSELAEVTAMAEALLAKESAAAAAAVQSAVHAAVESVSVAAPHEPIVVPVPHATLEKSASDKVEAANTAVQTHLVAELTRVLKQDLEGSFVEGVEHMTEHQLKEKVKALGKELNDRTKWEALRLNEFLQRSEEQWKAKFVEFTEFQHEALKAEVQAITKQIEADMQQKNAVWRQKELQKLHTDLQTEAQKQLDVFITQFKREEAMHTEDRVTSLAAMRGRVAGVDKILRDRLEYEDASSRVHKIALATVALRDAIDAKVPITDAAAALRVAGAGDELIEAVVDALPSELHRAGVHSRKEIYDRFNATAKEGRRAALVPSEGGVLGQALGTISSALFIKTSSNDTGEGPVSEVHAVMKVFDDAEAAMTNGDLKSAVASLQRLQGYPSAVVSGWLNIAGQRVAIDQALHAIQSHTALLIASMY